MKTRTVSVILQVSLDLDPELYSPEQIEGILAKPTSDFVWWATQDDIVDAETEPFTVLADIVRDDADLDRGEGLCCSFADAPTGTTVCTLPAYPDSVRRYCLMHHRAYQMQWAASQRIGEARPPEQQERDRYAESVDERRD
jgi:hypothetical protein